MCVKQLLVQRYLVQLAIWGGICKEDAQGTSRGTRGARHESSPHARERIQKMQGAKISDPFSREKQADRTYPDGWMHTTLCAYTHATSHTNAYKRTNKSHTHLAFFLLACHLNGGSRVRRETAEAACRIFGLELAGWEHGACCPLSNECLR